jgi:hypothetical protein
MRVIMISVFLLTMVISAWSERTVVVRAEQIKQASWGQLAPVNPELTGYR